MVKLKNFYNEISNDYRIYTAEDIGAMTRDEFAADEKAIDYQTKHLGIPRNNELIGNPDVIYVKAYTRDDGTKVKAHYRSKGDSDMTLTEAALSTFANVPDLTLPVAISNLGNSINNFKNAKNNNNAHILHSRTEIKNKDLNDLMDKVGIPQNSRGVIYDNNSKQSKKLWESSEIQNFVQQNYQQLMKSNQNPTAHIEF